MLKTRGVAVWVLALGAAGCGGGSSGHDAASAAQSANAGASNGGTSATGTEPAAGGAAGTGTGGGGTSSGGTAGRDTAGGGTAGTGATGRGSAGTIGAAGSSSAADCTLGSNWHIVDDYTYAAPTPTNVLSLASDSNGRLYAVGTGRKGSANVGLVRQSASGGGSWANVDWPEASLPSDVAADDAGNVFITARIGGGVRAVFRSTNGSAFENIYSLPLVQSDPNDACGEAFVTAASGGVVIAGISCSNEGWVVVQSGDHGTTWQTLFTFQLATGKNSRLLEVGIGPDVTAYATGYAVGTDDSVHWITARPGAGTTSGSLSDDFQLSDGATAEGGGFSSNGTPVVAGFANDGQAYHGVARRRNDHGGWDTIDTFDGRATDIEAVGNQLFISGYVEAATTSLITRRSDDRGASWNTMGDWQYVSGQSTGGGTLARDARGNVFAGLNGTDANGTVHWLVRKLDCEE